jgi:hypothetical protein
MLACQMVAAHEAAMACLGRSMAPAAAPEPVGLVQSEDGVWTVSFGPVVLGTIGRGGKLKRPGVGSRPLLGSATSAED